MKLVGIIILAVGLLLSAYALTMDVGVNVPAQDFGYGVATPAMRVANVDLMTQRQNYLIFSGILAVVGAILTGFGAMQPRPAPPENERRPVTSPNTATPATPAAKSAPTAVSICPNCRSMGAGDLTNCGRCGTPIGP
jgi:hypothetical protein